jgi:hypothetical protein
MTQIMLAGERNSLGDWFLNSRFRHARVLSPCPPRCGGGALGVSGIQTEHRRLPLLRPLDSRRAARPQWGLAARKSESTRE